MRLRKYKGLNDRQLKKKYRDERLYIHGKTKIITCSDNLNKVLKSLRASRERPKTIYIRPPYDMKVTLKQYIELEGNRE